MLYSWHSCFSLHGLPLEICQNRGAVATVPCDSVVVIFCCLSACPCLAWTRLWAHELQGYPLFHIDGGMRCSREQWVEEMTGRRRESSWPGFGTVLFVVTNTKDVSIRLPLL